MNTNTNEPTNEKGLTRQQYEGIMARNGNTLIRGTLLSGILALGGLAYSTIRAINRPIQPAGYQTYVDAGTTLSTLQLHKENLQRRLPNLPYAPDSLQEQLEGAFNDTRQVTKLDDITEIVESDMAQMREEHPEYAVYDNKMESSIKGILYGGLTGLAALLSGVALSIGIPAFAARRKRIGSNVWHQEQGAESK